METPTAQQIIDALRFALMPESDPLTKLALVDFFMETAPETTDNGGFDLITSLLAEGSLRLEMTYA